MATTAEVKYELITGRLQEVLGGDLIKTLLAEGKTPKCYWGEQLTCQLIDRAPQTSQDRYCSYRTT
jgi:hypothetical protein